MKRGAFLIFWVLSLFASITFAADGTSLSTQPTTQPATQPSSDRRVVVIEIEGQINDFTRDQLAKRLGHARQMGVKHVILQIDTYGGAVHAGLEMSAMLKGQSDLHVIAYVPEKAISAGAMIALACNEIVMGPAAKMGDAAPIAIMPSGELQPLPETERAKFESPVLEDFRHSARQNGYDSLLVESMVSVGKTVYWIENEQGTRKFVAAFPLKETEKDDTTWKLVPNVRQPIDSANELLTVSTDLALKLGLAKGTTGSAQSLADERGLTIATTFATSTGEMLVDLLNGAAIRGVLMIIFLLSLKIALHAPGHGGAEAVALTSLGLLLGVPLLAGYAQWWEIVLIIVGLGLLAAELFVIPGFGVAGFSGLALLAFGFVMTFVPKEPTGLPGFLPSLPATWSAVQSGLLALAISMIVSLLLAWWLGHYLPKMPYFSRLVLNTVVGDGSAAAVITGDTNGWPRQGDQGRAASDLKPGGLAQFLDPSAGDERVISVESDRGFIRAGTMILIHAIDGPRIVVRPVETGTA